MSEERENDDLERRLRRALRAVDPGAGFTPRVLARIAGEPAHAARPARAGAVAGWLAFGVTASLLFGVFVAHEWQVRRLEQGREARRQLIEALRVTDEKLDLAYRVVNSRESAAAAQDSGA